MCVREHKRDSACQEGCGGVRDVVSFGCTNGAVRIGEGTQGSEALYRSGRLHGVQIDVRRGHDMDQGGCVRVQEW